MTMVISAIHIYKFSIPMVPFSIATGTMHYAQNIFIRIHTSEGITGVGECSAFPMIAGETQSTCYEMAKDFAACWKGKDPLRIEERMNELHLFTAFNSTIKSAFDMALYDIAAKEKQLPLYKFLGGEKRPIETDLTIGIYSPEEMAQKAISFVKRGVRIIKIKLGKDVNEDIERVKQIRKAVGRDILLRIDANQGWTFRDAVDALQAMGEYGIEFCEQPMRYFDDEKLPELRRLSPIKIMADESVFDHHDAIRLIKNNACDYINIKFAKSGGILEAKKINDVAASHNIHCMMGGMLESRLALSAKLHFAYATPNIQFYDMDTCLLGHLEDPVTGGVKYKGFFLDIDDSPGIGADVEDAFLNKLESVCI